MAGYLSSSSLKMKRKDLDDVYDDFSDFSLSSPARKIRRLDAELPPGMEEEVEMQPVFDQFVPERQVPAEEFAVFPANEERAIVLYKPVNSPIVHSPSCFSVALDSENLSGYKKAYLNQAESSDTEARANDKNNGESSECMAMIPWVSWAEDAGAASMDIEGDNEGMVQGGSVGNESVQAMRWQQQHCMTPQLPPNTSFPIVWYP